MASKLSAPEPTAFFNVCARKLAKKFFFWVKRPVPENFQRVTGPSISNLNEKRNFYEELDEN